MRIAAISDVHGNAGALRAVLADPEVRAADLVVNLGDHLSGALDPAATAALLRATPAVSVRGNHDRQVVDDPVERLGDSDRRVRAECSPADLAWLSDLPVVARPAAGVVALHGTPDDDATPLLETITPAGARPASIDEVADRLAGLDDLDGLRLVLCGHTHLQRSLRLPDGALVVNPGSVGLPAYADDAPWPHVMEAGSPHARFAIVDDATGRFEVRFRTADYNVAAAVALARANGRSDAATSLASGRAPAPPA